MRKLAVLLFLTLAGCPSLPVRAWWGDSLPGELDCILRDYERAWNAHDAEALADLFTEDGYVLSNGRPPVRGRKAIRAAYANAGGELWLRPLYAHVDQHVGFIVGVYGHARDQPETGKFVLALEKFSTGWQIAADIDNSIERREGN